MSLPSLHFVLIRFLGQICSESPRRRCWGLVELIGSRRCVQGCWCVLLGDLVSCSVRGTSLLVLSWGIAGVFHVLRSAIRRCCSLLPRLDLARASFPFSVWVEIVLLFFLQTTFEVSVPWMTRRRRWMRWRRRRRMTTRRAATALAGMDRTAEEERDETCICSGVATIATSVPCKKWRSPPSLPTPSPPPAATTPTPPKPQEAARSSGPPRRNPAAGSGRSSGCVLLLPQVQRHEGEEEEQGQVCQGGRHEEQVPLKCLRQDRGDSRGQHCLMCHHQKGEIVFRWLPWGGNVRFLRGFQFRATDLDE
ncbi:uncharacterized protein LOC100845870 [Brachypodium distachyon]|uniref:uncharacterized protein LOC100845870 n=1 Tax=Brachypodium distachyon TaxID=15368 RepID=UPI00071E5359|nr:uncharacterized protein LOC100845870 [Brachypodium distachyon]XP_014758911.1 uncharacterized protein LOC100845870 [Brachypodium distachyon]XP_014758912.1 uncharacterized protein LOC100845870 [Brachypodium distachyon]XP_014758913.1 uncharacterized protein LOC100845870 [Brachypodium distachyon]XP_014758914.1 uncharacterized protein LOC100845870 [Brachypodium distachyon]XP_014758915.1 uncharacterized protein LOC100845870 [Brachypodium distachyon]XP_014758916.1 uncharacterized protein LOC10084|eukprot:XP_014758909.1 uncharacterized protein LOC100845870 [Brachypodium distachyon]